MSANESTVQGQSGRSGSNLAIRTLREEDVADVDKVFRSAFGTHLGYQEPEKFAPGRSCLARILAQPNGSFGAYLDDQLVGIACTALWGSVGVFGPLAIKPECWGRGIAQRLLTRAVDFFVTQRTSNPVLCTFPDSPKHISLYKKFGFHPGFLIAMMSKLVPESVSMSSAPLATLDLLSLQNEEVKSQIIDQCRALTNAIFLGLDLTVEMLVLEKISGGETVLLQEGNQVVAFAICHFGPGSETETDIFYIKFAAVLPSKDADDNFCALLKLCTRLAQERKLNTLFCGVNTGRQEAFEVMLSEGFNVDSLGVAMQMSNLSSYNQAGVYVLDDWR